MKVFILIVFILSKMRRRRERRGWSHCLRSGRDGRGGKEGRRVCTLDATLQKCMITDMEKDGGVGRQGGKISPLHSREAAIENTSKSENYLKTEEQTTYKKERREDHRQKGEVAET